jgi:hypothetical protein
MNKLFYIAKRGLMLACLGLGTISANAATFTAVTSGNFSSSATWGGTAPSQMITSDIVVIPSNITVTLDQNATFSGVLATLVVNGTLVSSQNEDLVVSTGSLSGNGTIEVDSMSIGLASGFGFTGAIDADKFTSTGANVSSAATVMVNNSLYLTGGILNLVSGNISLGSNATIYVNGGSINQNGGTINLTSAYNVHYMSSVNVMSGLELSGTGIMNVDVDMGSGASLMLTSDMDVYGMLTLHAGMLDLNGNDLNLMGNANINTTGSGTITAGSGSNINVSTANSINGSLNFTAGGNTVNNFTLNMGNSSNSVKLGGNLIVNGTLDLQSGRLDAGTHNVMIAIGGSVMNGSSSGYVMTGIGGSLTMHLVASASNMYYIGTSAGYYPATVTANSGSASGDVSVSVNTDVFVNGMNGATLSSDQPLVNNTWYVSSTNTSNIDLNLDVMWNTAAEVHGFNRNTAYISHYVNGGWDASATASATTTTNGMFKLSRNNITSLSPFAVMDEKAVVTGVNEAQVTNVFDIYPNPATDVAIFSTGRAAHILISDLSGQVMKTFDIVPGKNDVAIDMLASGVYAVQVVGNGFVYTTKLVKQ